MENKTITVNVRESYINGILIKKEYLNDKNELHRDKDKPAFIEYYYNLTKMINSKTCYQNDEISFIIWYKNNKIHRDNDLPSYISYHYNGNIREKIWHKYGKLYRDNDLPVYIEYDDDGNIIREEWRVYSGIHRYNDLPACILYDKEGNIISKTWYQNGKKHRPVENGPARIIYNNNIIEKEYYLNDKLVEKPIKKLYW
jgi:antitoxin component YwqK of YwqJK toxin-antitoxin module